MEDVNLSVHSMTRLFVVGVKQKSWCQLYEQEIFDTFMVSLVYP